MRVLLIDDEPGVCKLVETMLSAAGHSVAIAENGRAGLELLGRSDFDVVLTDIIMPETEGIEVIMTIRQRFPDLRIVAMSGGGRTGNVDFLAAAGKLGASATLKKPFTIRALHKAIGESLTAGKTT